MLVCVSQEISNMAKIHEDKLPLDHRWCLNQHSLKCTDMLHNLNLILRALNAINAE